MGCSFNTQQDLDLHVNYLVTHVQHYTVDHPLPCHSVTLTAPFNRDAQMNKNPCLRLQSNNYERMNLDFDHELYNQSHVPSDVVIRFLADTLPCLGWGKKCKEVVMDVGCGDGDITVDLIMPLFPRLEKMVAFDVLPKMIDVASKLNSHPRIEYAVADIEDWYDSKYGFPLQELP
ncbi:hypothetical protein AVEN_201807-1 [Araneus ventricosus]|uniref:Methyltransferase domain-containing protein n=1 Tax=Araneus ventricosus TaxID=182803 RepID=A0A4Y2MCZ6_ARAVE|nr:hypothetical protein AVEN_201807-1 [Araneus ventricosus]